MSILFSQIFDLDPLTIWAPTIEVSSVEDAFLTEDPKDWIENSTKPLLVGFNGAEGGLKTTSGYLNQYYEF